VYRVGLVVGVEGKLGGQAKVPGAAGTWKDLTENVNQLAENLTTQVRAIAEVATAVTQGDLTRSITVQAQGEVAALKDPINEMIRNLKDTTQKNTEQDWLKTNLAKFSRMLQGQKALEAVGGLILSELAPVVAATHAEFYVLDQLEDNPAGLVLVASYAAQGRASHGKRVELGQGLIGQCAIERRKILLPRVPEDYLSISSGLGEARPRNILVLPIVFETQIKGVLELASFEGFSDTHQAFLEQLMESIGIVINTIEANTRTEDLLAQSQSLARELQNRQEELQQTNQELQEKARLLAHQNEEVERKNQEVEQARQALEDKARQLALTSKYKSEFLANMSHELRTPLNSLLILSDQLCLNPQHNLSPKQVDFAKIIHASGNELLGLINDILDLSKIESGTVAVDVGELRVEELNRYVERTFRHIAESKNVRFAVRLDAGLPGSLFTDVKRLQQIIKNLLSNAFKFTSQGEVSLSIRPAAAGWNPDNEELNRAAAVVAFAVSDTGIGIPSDKQQIVFEAFQQVDGSTSRKFGGTGLGLAISRELARLLGGEIGLTSTPGRGSIFTLYLPTTYFFRGARAAEEAAAGEANAAIHAAMEASQGNQPLPGEGMPRRPQGGVAVPVNEAGDDRDVAQPGERSVLIVESDLAFARFLLESARNRGFRGLVSRSGLGACALMQEYRPSAIILNISLGDIDGWRLIARLKNDLAMRHLPVCVIAATDDARDRAIRAGARGFVAGRDNAISARMIEQLMAYLERTSRRVLVMDDKPAALETIKSCIEVLPQVEVLAATDLASAQEAINHSACDCVVLGESVAHTMLPALARAVHPSAAETCTPFIVYTPATGSIDAAREAIAQHPNTAQVGSHERLLDQLAVALHRAIDDLPAREREVLKGLHNSNRALAGKKVLIVDDDVRNIFALSAVLEEYDMRIMSAENGRDAIGILRTQPEIDIVLMDIMMPDLDGFDTIREVRRLDLRRDLPIVAVTAKAMKGDRERCMAAGAWDYLSKPVDRKRLVRVLRAWLQD
jgi:signal transduction histidine kinase/DNA-binding response OmpR family regulator/HAMP domain-containing protein